MRQRVHELRLDRLPLPGIALPRFGGKRTNVEVLAALAAAPAPCFSFALVAHSRPGAVVLSV